ncbi:MmgE/PrpD family protein [Actinophytocola sp.]|jgi:2-methylcitrate dehydratase PrpD|uniref:MmgE/PrpD family protein n=1 Tax=Actinophytocola sp. TaxID=1872138 RepID=UPI002ED7CFEB
MTRTAERLAERARGTVGEDEYEALRALTLTNIAAAAGERGSMAELARRLPLDAGQSPGEAAFQFAAQLHARTQDDFFPEGRVHVGAIVLAATLALAEEAGDRTLDCLAAGYRVMCDVSASYSTEAQRAGLRPSGVFGPFGAAAAAATALSFSPAETVNAIALAAAACGGHNQAWISSTDEWILEVGAAARAGVEAALFTRAGARAAPEAFEGAAGWAAAHFREPGAGALARHVAGPVTDARVVAVKPYPVSGIAQVATDLACGLHTALAGRRPSAVRVRLSAIESAYPGSANTGPFTSRSGALMSVAFCVACGLLDGRVRLDRLENPGTDDLRELLAVVDMAADTELPENESRVEVDVDGVTLVRTGRAADLLFPGWPALRADTEALARRSEADPGVVADAAAELGRARPDAVVLRRLLSAPRPTAPQSTPQRAEVAS